MQKRQTPRIFRTQAARRKAPSHLRDLFNPWVGLLPLFAVRDLEARLRSQPDTLVDVAARLRLLLDPASPLSSPPQIPQRPFAKAPGLDAWRTRHG